jgi:hypothetical protein
MFRHSWATPQIRKDLLAVLRVIRVPLREVSVEKLVGCENGRLEVS